MVRFLLFAAVVLTSCRSFDKQQLIEDVEAQLADSITHDRVVAGYSYESVQELEPTREVCVLYHSEGELQLTRGYITSLQQNVDEEHDICLKDTLEAKRARKERVNPVAFFRDESFAASRSVLFSSLRIQSDPDKSDQFITVPACSVAAVMDEKNVSAQYTSSNTLGTVALVTGIILGLAMLAGLGAYSLSNGIASSASGLRFPTGFIP